MNKIHHTFLTVLSIITISASAYFYFSQGLHPASAESGLTSSLNTNPSSTASSVSDKIALDISFIDKLASLTDITIDTKLFSNDSFNSLKDNTVVLEPVLSGRQNPFAPIESSMMGANVASVPVSTIEANQITDKNAIFNGSIKSSLTGVTSAYFEYGTTKDLGKVTSPAELSLIGTFIKKVVNLTPKTTYYFRAVAKVNGVPIYGDIVSFNTN